MQQHYINHFYHMYKNKMKKLDCNRNDDGSHDEAFATQRYF